MIRLENLLNDLQELHTHFEYVASCIDKSNCNVSIREAWASMTNNYYRNQAEKKLVDECKPQLKQIDKLMKKIQSEFTLMSDSISSYCELVNRFNNDMTEEVVHQSELTIFQTEYCMKKV